MIILLNSSPKLYFDSAFITSIPYCCKSLYDLTANGLGGIWHVTSLYTNTPSA